MATVDPLKDFKNPSKAFKKRLGEWGGGKWGSEC